MCEFGLQLLIVGDFEILEISETLRDEAYQVPASGMVDGFDLVEGSEDDEDLGCHCVSILNRVGCLVGTVDVQSEVRVEESFIRAGH